MAKLTMIFDNLFQFLMVRLKGPGLEIVSHEALFQFLMVRLKVELRAMNEDYTDSFNSLWYD